MAVDIESEAQPAAQQVEPEWSSFSDPWFTGWLRRVGWLNRRLDRNMTRLCDEFQAAFEQRLGDKADAAVVAAVRSDTVKMNRWSARRDLVTECFQEVYWNIRHMLGILAAAVLPALLFSDGPLWLRWVFIVFAALLVWMGVEGFDRKTLPGSSDVGFALFALVCGVLGSVLLIAFPATPQGWLVALVSGLSAYGIAWLLMRVADWVVGRFAGPYSSALVLTVGGVGLFAAWRYLGAVTRSDWFQFGVAVGLVIGATVAVALAALQFGLGAVFFPVHDLRKFRLAPEAEFVQSILWVMAKFRSDSPAPDRWSLVHGMEYLARLLEQAVCAALGREDPESRPTIAKELAGRAGAIRTHKRSVLLGKPDAQDEMLAMLDGVLVAAARRDWQALTSVAVDGQQPREGRSVRIRRGAVRLALLVLPIAVLAAIWLLAKSQLSSWLPAVLPFVITTIAGNLAGFAPRSGSDKGSVTSHATT